MVLKIYYLVKMGILFSHFEIYLDNFERPKSSGTMHTCDVKLQ
jgi:hypothetical protein